MFSWIITGTAPIISCKQWTFEVANIFTEKLTIWQSIAHDGACMTVTQIHDNSYEFFAMEESLQRTNFGQKKAGNHFNVELCVRYGDRIDGHFVTGHIDTIGTVSGMETASDGSQKITISYDTSYHSLIVPKGSIAINGVSLTVVDDISTSSASFFSVWIIPHTQDITNIGTLSVWDKVNLEFDMLAKYIHKKTPQQ